MNSRYSHSFPTRRSSDLLLVDPYEPRLRERRDEIGAAVAGREAIEGSRLRTNRDRKSTRLNSSHEWISYAVFCLKKKSRNLRLRMGARLHLAPIARSLRTPHRNKLERTSVAFSGIMIGVYFIFINEFPIFSLFPYTTLFRSSSC